MSRSGYSDDCDNDWRLICYRGAVNSAINGKRGQSFLKEMIAAMDALPDRKLVRDELETKSGAVCAIGAVGRARGIDMSKLDPHDPETVAGTFGIATALAREIVYLNDDDGPYKESPEATFTRMRKWADACIVKAVNRAAPPGRR